MHVERSVSCGLADQAIFVVQSVEDRRRDHVTSSGVFLLETRFALKLDLSTVAVCGEVDLGALKILLFNNKALVGRLRHQM
jgi:hypothetical protein